MVIILLSLFYSKMSSNQCPSSSESEACSDYTFVLQVVYYRIFNTNNLWVNLKAMDSLMKKKQLHMEVIVNNKVNV